MTARLLTLSIILSLVCFAPTLSPTVAAQATAPATSPDKTPEEAEYDALVKQSQSDYIKKKFACFLGDGKWKGIFSRGVTEKSIRNNIPAPFSLKYLDHSGVFKNVQDFVAVTKTKLNRDRPPCLVNYTLDTREGRDQAQKDMELFAKLAPIWAQEGVLLKP